MDTIKSNEEISRIFKSGKRLSNKYATFVFVEKGAECKHSRKHGPCGRVAFLAGKRLGGAVWRNSAKRRMREVCRSCSSSIKDKDVLFIAKAPIMLASYSKVLNACEETMRRIGSEGI